MSDNKDIPLVEDLEQSEEVRSLLRAGMDDDLEGYDFDKGLATHVAAVAALQAAAAATATKVAMSSKVLAAWIAVPLASVTVLGALWFGGSSDAPEKAPRGQSTKLPKSAPAAVVADAPDTEAPVVEAEQPVVAEVVDDKASRDESAEVLTTPKHVRTASRAPVERTERAAKIDTSSGGTATPRSTATFETALEAQPTTAAANVQPSAPEPVEVAPSRAEREQAAREEAAAREAARAQQEEARRVADQRLKREMSLLMQAKQALASDPGRALTLAMAGEQQFRGDSMFGEERQHVLVLALIKLGRVEEAEQRAQPFLRAHPDSPFARRIRNALQAAR